MLIHNNHNYRPTDRNGIEQYTTIKNRIEYVLVARTYADNKPYVDNNRMYQICRIACRIMNFMLNETL